MLFNDVFNDVFHMVYLNDQRHIVTSRYTLTEANFVYFSEKI